MELKTEEVAENWGKDYLPEYRSGGYSDRGIRRTMEDAHVCIDDLEEQLGTRGAFYGVSDFFFQVSQFEGATWFIV